MQDAEVDEVIKRVNRAAERVEQMAEGGNRNTTRVEINAGGVGVWLCLVACVAMLAVTVVGSIYLTRELGEQDRQLQELREKDEIHSAWLQTLNNNKQDKSK